MESEAPPSSPLGSWYGLRRLLVLYALLLAASVLYAVLDALDAAPEPVIDAGVSAGMCVVVLAFALLDWRKLWPWLDPRQLSLRRAGWIALATVPTVLLLKSYFLALDLLDIPSYRYWPMFEQEGWPLWSAFLLVAAVPGIIEEVAFRGLMYEGLARVMARREALLVQAMAFSVLHLSPLIFVSHFLIGLSLGLLRDATRSLYPGMLAHAAWNAFIIAEESGVLPW